MSLFVAFIFCGIAFGQGTPNLTLNSNVSLFNFGRFNVGAVSPETVITISTDSIAVTTGVASVTISNVTITGANAGDFTLTATTCNNATLGAGQTCTATVSFSPLLVGVRNANLTVTDTAPGSQHLVPLTGTGLDPALPNKALGPVDPRIGFPRWYQDELGVRLTMCLDNSGYCVAFPAGFDPNLPASVTSASVNFPEEAFYWYADARITNGSGGVRRLVIAKEGAFTTAGAAVGKQITFERVRIILDQLTPGATYRITHPFGVVTAIAGATGNIAVTLPLNRVSAVPAAGGANSIPASHGGAQIDMTEDIGCGTSPCDFRAAQDGQISRFLKWDPAVAPAAPAGYLGSGAVLHTITGSPFNTNFFRVEGPSVGGNGINMVETDQFILAGKLFQ